MNDILNICVTAATAAYTQMQLNLRDEVTAWVGLACTIAVTLVTCAVNVYRLWRDRDNDKHKCKKQDEQSEEQSEENNG